MTKPMISKSSWMAAAAVVAVLCFSAAAARAQDADAQSSDGQSAPANTTFGGAIAPAPPENNTYGGAIAPVQPDANGGAPATYGQAPVQQGNQGQMSGMLQQLNNMTPEQRSQLMSQAQAAAQGAAQAAGPTVDSIKAKMMAEWEAATPEQRQAVIQRLHDQGSVDTMQQYLIDHAQAAQNLPPEARAIIVNSAKKALADFQASPQGQAPVPDVTNMNGNAGTSPGTVPQQ
jgi:hypothetical protein